MLEEWLSPLLEWLGIGIVPFLVLVIIVVMLIKS